MISIFTTQIKRRNHPVFRRTRRICRRVTGTKAKIPKKASLCLYVQGLPELRAGVLDCPTAVVHGWRDDVVPYEHSVRFAQTYKAALHLVEGDHRLHNQVRVIQYLFEYFLIALDLPAVAFE